MPRFTDTIAALATPVGTSAIAVVRASGTETARLTREIFGELPPPRVARHADYCRADGVLVDDVLFTFFPAGGSYTGEDALEVSCHGNPFIAQKIVEDLLARGCRSAEPGEFTQRAFLNGRMDLSQAEAVMDLIHARSEQSLAAANQQLRGSMGRRMQDLTDRLLRVLARVEAQIDFPEEDLPAEDRAGMLQEIKALANDTDGLLATSHYGELLREGIKTVIIGAPNAGKSSLLNRLVGQERAIVSAEPGTTRDFIEERILLGPYFLRLIDTAGLNPSPGKLESLGIEKTLERLAEADIVLWVIDLESPLPVISEDVTERISKARTILVRNKSDLATIHGSHLPSYPFPTCNVSAKTGAGIQGLVEEIIRTADSLLPSRNEEVVAINSRHADSLQLANRCLQDAQQKLAVPISLELIASDLRGTLAAYGEIIGKVDNERMLDSLFATFCIGK